MISRQSLVNKLRSLGYVFKDRRHFSELWRKKGGTHCATIPLKNQLTEATVILILSQAGQTRQEIEQFIRDAKS